MRSFFGYVLRGLDGLRKVLHLLLLLLILGFVVGALRTSIPRLPAKAALLVQPEGEIVEQAAGDPFERAVAEARGLGNDETPLRDLTDVIDAARSDARIQALVLDFDAMSGGGQPTLDEFARAVDAFRKSGKKVIARGTGFTRDTYYVAAHADEIYVEPLGFVMLEGYDRYRMYFKGAFDKFGVDMNVFRVGAYKSAVEPYVRQDMSEQDREESVAYLGSLWNTYLESVAKARGLKADDLRTRVASLADDVEAAAGDTSKVALQSKLVTGIKSSIEVEARVAELVGEDEEKGTYNAVQFADYLRVVRAEQKLRKEADARIGVLVASGEIVSTDPPTAPPARPAAGWCFPGLTPQDWMRCCISATATSRPPKRSPGAPIRIRGSGRRNQRLGSFPSPPESLARGPTTTSTSRSGCRTSLATRRMSSRVTARTRWP